MLRVAGGVFYGLGDRPAEDPKMAEGADEETSETTGGKDDTPLTMIIPPADVTVTDVLAGLASVAGALIMAGLGLYWRRLPLLRGYRPSASLAAAARRFQSGVVNDYVTWIVVSLACLGGVFALIVRLPARSPGRRPP